MGASRLRVNIVTERISEVMMEALVSLIVRYCNICLKKVLFEVSWMNVAARNPIILPFVRDE